MPFVAPLVTEPVPLIVVSMLLPSTIVAVTDPVPVSVTSDG
jgi:hypothetical protein